MSNAVPSADRVLETLQSTFGFSAFRPLQAPIVQAILERRDVFVLMPTGGGKSLCYQLPALLMDGLTVVVSPLIALMKDQVDALGVLGAPATFINSSLEPFEAGRRLAAVSRGEVKLLYVAPERLMMPAFLERLATTPPTFFAIDEAHCISEWGHDFRPEYRKLIQLRELFPKTPIGAFTATATGRVQADIVQQLRLDGGQSFRGSFNRPNLFYEVRPKQNAYRQLISYLRAHGSAAGIVYCATRAGTEELAARLEADGFRAAAYHAGLVAETRRQRQEAFARDEIQIIVATIAFGMGIDKPDVRFVVHYDLPKNLESYYQESGRAGRDGRPSDCILFYSYGDAVKQEFFIKQIASDLEQRAARARLRQMIDWAGRTTCRREALLAYFDEVLDSPAEPCCDACRNPVGLEDRTIQAKMLLSCVLRTGERFGLVYLIDVLLGSANERISRFGHDRLKTYGVGQQHSQEEWRHIGRELLRAGYIRQDQDSFNAIKVTTRGRSVLFEGQTAMLPGLQQRTRRRRFS